MSLLITASLIACATANIYSPSSGPANDSLRARIGRRIAEEHGAIVGVAFHDLQTGDSLYLNADDSFHAASTMKVPVMIELFRSIDAGALRLDQGILLVNQFGSIVDGSPYSLDAGDDSDSSAYKLTRTPQRRKGPITSRDA